MVVVVKSLINAGCATFSAAVRLLRSDHAKQKIKDKLNDLKISKLRNFEIRKIVYISIFGNEFRLIEFIQTV